MTESSSRKRDEGPKGRAPEARKNPWAAFDEVRSFARQGSQKRVARLGFHLFQVVGHLYAGDGVGATGGKGGEGLASEFFMMRIGIPNGIVSSSTRVIGDWTKQYARNLADITVRQNIQLHWLTIESLPEIVDALDAIGLSPKGACGDVVRNVTGCPLAGVAADELIDAAPLAAEISQLLKGNPDFYNLPRTNSKISVTGCPSWCSYPEINDIALTATKHDGHVGLFAARGRRPLKGTAPGVRLNAFVLPDQAVRVARAIAEIFRDQQRLRENRNEARMKYLFLKEGWTAESFLTELHSRLDFKLLPAAPEQVPDDISATTRAFIRSASQD